MNKSTSFQPVRNIIFSGISLRCFPAFLTLWGGQTERQAAFLNVKLHAARFRVCVGLLADRWVAAAVIKQPFLQGGVVGADMASVLSFYPEMASVIKAPSPLKLGLSGKKKAPQS